VIDVADGTHVDVGLLPLELRLAHELLPPSPVLAGLRFGEATAAHRGTRLGANALRYRLVVRELHRERRATLRP
jgi:hypothetical protein